MDEKEVTEIEKILTRDEDVVRVLRNEDRGINVVHAICSLARKALRMEAAMLKPGPVVEEKPEKPTSIEEVVKMAETSPPDIQIEQGAGGKAVVVEKTTGKIIARQG